MDNMLLEFKPVIDNQNLVSRSVFETVTNWNKEDKKEFLVAEIDEAFAAGIDLCNKYNIDTRYGANCLIVVGIRGMSKTYAALVVPVGFKYDMSHIVKKMMNARMVSVASLEYVLEKTNMEFGSITPIGLPDDWLILIDPKVLENEKIIIGGGLKKSKLIIPSKALLSLPNSMILEGLAKKKE